MVEDSSIKCLEVAEFKLCSLSDLDIYIAWCIVNQQQNYLLVVFHILIKHIHPMTETQNRIIFQLSLILQNNVTVISEYLNATYVLTQVCYSQ